MRLRRDRQLRQLVRGLTAPRSAEEQADIDRCEQARELLLGDGTLVGDVFEATGQPGRHRSVGDEAMEASAPPDKARCLYRLVRRLQPVCVVEFGSALGVSGAYLASALRANGHGQLVTVEGSASRQAIARRTIESVAPGVTEYRRALFDDAFDVLDGCDLFFNDGNHWREAVHAYALEASRRMTRPAVIVVDDVRDYSEEMAAAFDSLPGLLGAQSAVVGQLGFLRLT